MQSISISTNWSTSKPIESCLFVQHFTGDDIKVKNKSDINEDIETLLESYENCVQLSEQMSNLNEVSKECKLVIKIVNESNDERITRIHSFSMLCSAKVVEIHGNDSNEYLTTVFNELVDELEGLSMFRSDHVFSEPQKETIITFKSFNELWIYGFVIKLIDIKREPPIVSKDLSSFGSIFNMITMFSNASKNNSSADLIKKLSQLKTSEISSENSSVIVSTNTKTSDEPKPNSSEQRFSECFCHKNCVSDQNRDYLCRYIRTRRLFVPLRRAGLSNGQRWPYGLPARRYLPIKWSDDEEDGDDEDKEEEEEEVN